jgi:hypothetical protein
MTRRRAPFRKAPDGNIEVHLPSAVTDLVADAAAAITRAGDQPASAAFRRLFAHIDDSESDDDPAFVLARQLMVDDVVSTVVASARKQVITQDEAEAWLKVLGMTLARHAAELGLRTEEDRAALRRRDQALLTVLQAVQLGLIDALETPR